MTFFTPDETPHTGPCWSDQQPWTETEQDPDFAGRYVQGRRFTALYRSIEKSTEPDAAGLRADLAWLVRRVHAGILAKFNSWQPSARALRRPN